jgi:nanoRNase/pAp phosphatase (c-di-AMP/oligoRNAs hydrolase)
MKKTSIKSVKLKNKVISNIINAMARRKHFLLLGHENPDEDCIASMVAFGLLLHKFDKNANIYIHSNIHKHFQYLLNICKFNAIQVLDSCSKNKKTIDTIVICDTPKPAMVETDKTIKNLLEDKDILKIEIDHHLGADSRYIGDRDYCLVTEASSAAELVGHIALAMQRKKQLLKKYQITEVFTRNVVLAILTGIIGDSNMGKYLKSEKEKRYYRKFSKMFNDLLLEKTTKDTNLSDKNQVFNQLQKLSEDEEYCFNKFLSKKKFSKSIGYIVLDEKLMKNIYSKHDNDTIVAIARSSADTLAEESKKLSLVVYYDNPLISNLIQFRIRRSLSFKKFDVREILNKFSIKNGGGHEGAIGFRFEKSSIKNINKYVEKLIKGIEEEIS